MLRLSKQADYATMLMSCMAQQPDAVRNVAELSADTRVSAPMVSKTLKLLARDGLIESVRGAAGGYRLARTAESISIADIVNAVEGPIAVTECSGDDSQCALEAHCRVRPHWQIINATIINSLKTLSLAELRRPAAKLDAPVRFEMNANAY